MEKLIIKKWFNKPTLDVLADEIIKEDTASGIDRVSYSAFIRNKDVYINQILESVNNKSYKFHRYKEKLVSKGRKKYPRVISIPTIRDRLTLKVLQLILNEKFTTSRTVLPQAIIKDVKVLYSKYNYLLKFDLKNFYGEINHRKLVNTIKTKIKNKYVIHLIKEAINNPIYPDSEKTLKGVHQGLSISNILAEIYLLDMDQHFRSDINLSYFRYVDDVLILCKANNKETIVKQFNEIVINLKLKTSQEKNKESELINSNFLYLGYNFKFYDDVGITRLSLNPSKKSVIRFHDKIVREIGKNKEIIRRNPDSIKRFVFELNLLLAGSIGKICYKSHSTDKRYGWHFFYSQLNDLTSLYQTDALVDYQLNKVGVHFSEKVKKVSSAHYEQKYNCNNSTYFFRPDSLSITEKKRILKDIYMISEEKLISDKMVSYEFNKNIYKKIKELEEDLFLGIS